MATFLINIFYFCILALVVVLTNQLSSVLKMEQYKSKSKKELLEIIAQLEKQVDVLSLHSVISESEKTSVATNNSMPHTAANNLFSIPNKKQFNSNDSDNLHAQLNDMKRLNSFLNVLLDNAPIFLFIKDTGDNFNYVYWNKMFADYSGISAEEAIGHNDFEIFPNSNDVERFYEDDLKTLEEGRLEYIEEYTAANGEERMTKTVKILVPSGNERPYIVGISWDLTDILKMKKELVDARIKAEESDRLKSAFLSNMTHEIRTPLNAIVGFSRLVVDSQVQTEKELYADIIEKNSNLLLNLFNDILDLSALETGTLELAVRMIQVKDICDLLYNKHKDNVAPSVELILDPIDSKICIEGDWKRIVQIGNHLVANAIKFTNEGEIHIGFYKKRDMIHFYIKDTGIGINPRRSNSIFQRFDKVDKFVQGSGLGLPICRMLVEKMGGEIWVNSKLGKGSTFYFSLPIKAPQLVS